MSVNTKVTLPQILDTARETPAGWVKNDDIQVEWSSRVVLNMLSTRYEGITFKKGDKQISLTWEELEKRLGMEW